MTDNTFTPLTIEEFLRQAQSPDISPVIDSALNAIQVVTGASDREMLRAFSFLMRSIAIAMPWNEKDGLDAARIHIPSRSTLPSFRSCIGACLNLEFSKPEDVTQKLRPNDDDEAEGDDGAVHRQ